jgi:hypothetical protein
MDIVGQAAWLLASYWFWYCVLGLDASSRKEQEASSTQQKPHLLNGAGGDRSSAGWRVIYALVPAPA